MFKKPHMPHPGHEQHLCYLVNMRFNEKYLKEFKELVKDGQFICKHCGRIAVNKKQLCKPVSI